MKRLKIWYLLLILVSAGMMLEAKTPYQRGYSDGCQSARRGVIIRQTRPFNNNLNYRKGWFAGKRACRPRRVNNPAVWNYNRGYKDGCRSARGRWRKNVTAFRRFPAYRNGWNAGWRKCKRPVGIAAVWNSYSRGYSDGCMSAKGNWHKNLRAYNRFLAYRRGWNNGWRACKRRISGWNSYSRGFKDGCSTARGTWRKNVTAYRRFAAYRNGWNAGRRSCARKNNPWNNYNIGYRDGCSSARGVWMKNVHAYRVFVAYRRGWNNGWASCKRWRRGTALQAWNSYSIGYNDGCSSGRGVWRKNIKAYRRFRAYRNGWIAGKRNCSIRGGAVTTGAAVVAAKPVLENAAQSDATANEISRIIYNVKEYMRQNYIKKPLPKAVELQIHTLTMDNGYAMVDVTPIFSDGSEISADYLPDIPYQFCMKQDQNGDWRVIYDLSHSGDLTAADLEQIRAEFPKEFPVALLPEYWKQVLTGQDVNRTIPTSKPGKTEMIDDTQPGTNPATRSSEIPLQTQ